MDGHVINQGQISAGDGSAPTSSGSSLVVQQFLALASGRITVHKPANIYRTIKVIAEERYCFGCFGVHWHDLIVVALTATEKGATAICRCCGKNGPP